MATQVKIYKPANVRHGFEMPEITEEIKLSTCQGCEHLIQRIRCGDLNCGCPAGVTRIEPWKNRVFCKKWREKAFELTSENNSDGE